MKNALAYNKIELISFSSSSTVQALGNQLNALNVLTKEGREEEKKL
jgi:hypothetical protein